MSLGILSGKTLGDWAAGQGAGGGQAASASREAQLYPWHAFSSDTLKLQLQTNKALQAAGFCPVPTSGILDGATCGARNHLHLRSKEFFGTDARFDPPAAMPFYAPLTCKTDDQSDPLSMPTSGCFQPTGRAGLFKLMGEAEDPVQARKNWVMFGGVASAALAVFLVFKHKGK